MHEVFAQVVYSRDRHPTDHCSFAAQGGPWPEHCIEGTEGYSFHPELPIVPGAHIVDKATDREQDAYSAFDGTGLAHWLADQRIRRVAVCGLATEYCIRATVLDAMANGLDTWLVMDAIAAVDRFPGDRERAILEMRAAGAELTESGALPTIFTHHPRRSALLVIDVQNDFCPGGALAVPGAERIFAPIRLLLELAAGTRVVP